MIPEDFIIPGGEDKFLELIDDLPFGQSAYQIKNLQLQQLSKERTRRQVLLEMWEKYKALKECYFNRQQKQIERKRLEWKAKWLPFKNMRDMAKVELARKAYEIAMENKLLKDALHDFDLYKQCYDSMPEMTREEYEKSESKYWKDRLMGDARMAIIAGNISPMLSPGTLESLMKIGVSPAEVLEELKVPIAEKMLPLLEDGKR